MPVRATLIRKRLLSWLVDLANSREDAGQKLAIIIRGRSAEAAGPLRPMIKETDGLPLLYLGGIDPHTCATERVQREAIRLLGRLCDDMASGWGAHRIEDQFNQAGIRCKVLAARPHTDVQKPRTRGDPWGPTILVPWARKPHEIPLYVLLAARSVETPEGGTLADRVTQCQECGKFFVRRTRQASGFCSDPCRWRATNQSRPNRPRRSRVRRST